jgi:hypothetical protein
MRLHRARELSVKVVIDSDTHSIEPLRFTRYGANHGQVEEPHVLNTVQWAPLHPLAKQRQKVPVTYQVSAACHELPIRVTLSGARHLKAQPLQILRGSFLLHDLRIELPRLRDAPYPRHDVVGEVES